MRTLFAVALLTGCITDGADDAVVGPSTLAKPTIFDRLGDTAGPIPGLAGFTIERTPDAAYCGGVAVRIVRAPAATVAAADEAFVRMLELPSPTGLEFETVDKKQHSLNSFKHWFETLRTTAEDAIRGYRTQLRGDTGAAAIAAVARVVQVQRWMASALVRMEMPLDVREGEHATDTQAAFCDQLATAAEPLLARADDAVRSCVEKSAAFASGWWSAVCK
jgi:hypothetical protein